MSNHLAGETSPYLLQHAENPVEWYPWGEEALSKARTEDKPILLSIGYSACHWCHVMAHESFQNPTIASLMNENFINIKVDREERPDIDAVYMEAVQSITGSGGWPLTVFLTPEGKPFFGGTYFPPEDKSGMPGFPRILEAVMDFYRNRRSEVEQATQQIIATLNSRSAGNSSKEYLSVNILNKAFSALTYDFDGKNGGFGSAPKFPQPLALEFLLRNYQRTGNKDSLTMVTLTLEKMAKGGIYDQIGGGFHRYATDRQWLVPHFEKMLYDNALLSQVYLHAYLVTKKPLFRRIAVETIDYILREMTSPSGGFYSTQDADSEGEEGKYYLWSHEEIQNVIGIRLSGIIDQYFGVTIEGNFEGRNILHISNNLASEEPDIIKRAKPSLLREREKRIKPGLDNKILTSWNGLMLNTIAEAACIFNRNDYLAAAVVNGSFLLDSLTSVGYLNHVYSHKGSKIDGYLEDYTSLIEGLLTLHQATFKGRWLREAIRLSEIIVREFWDESTGMFFDTSKRQSALFTRPSSTSDGALPSGSSAATFAILKLSRLTGNDDFKRIAEKALNTIEGKMSQYPLGFGKWLCALDFFLSESKEIVVIGPRETSATKDLLETIYNVWLPNKVFAALDPSDKSPVVDLELLRNKDMIKNKPTVFLCQNHSCRTPIVDPNMLVKLLLAN